MAQTTLSEVLNQIAERHGSEIRVGLPGRVESYDAATQLASVKPLIKDRIEGEDGAPIDKSLPVIPNVPVLFMGGGGMRLTFPVRAGDTGWLMFSDRSLDAWLDQGGETAPADLRRHNISDAVFWPGLHPNNAPWTGADTSVITLGSDSGSAQFVALANKVDAALALIKSHGHAVNGGTTSGNTVTAAGAGASADLASMDTATGSATVKVKG